MKKLRLIFNSNFLRRSKTLFVFTFFLISFLAYSQVKIVFTEEMMYQLDHYVNFDDDYAVKLKSFNDGLIVNPDYEKGDYVHMGKFINKEIELISKPVTLYNYRGEIDKTLNSKNIFKDVSNNSYYYLQATTDINEILSDRRGDVTITNYYPKETLLLAEKAVKKAGYTVLTKPDGTKYFKTKHFTFNVEEFMHSMLQEEPNRFQKLDVQYEKYFHSLKQLHLLAPKLKSYLQLYNIQRRNMPQQKIAEWSALTKQGLKHLNTLVENDIVITMGASFGKYSEYGQTDVYLTPLSNSRYYLGL